MRIFRLGSCRIFNLKDDNCNYTFINEPIGYSHSLKEHIQLINFLRGKTKINGDLLKYIFTFYGGKQLKQNIDQITKDNALALNKADLFLIEVCSLKIFQFQNYFFQLSRFRNYDKFEIEQPSTEILQGTDCYSQSPSEFEQDFQKIIALLDNKPCIFTGHLNVVSKKTGAKIKNRMLLDQYLRKNTQKYGSCYYDLSTQILRDQDKYIEEDLNHLKPPAYELVNNFISNFVQIYNQDKFQ